MGIKLALRELWYCHKEWIVSAAGVLSGLAILRILFHIMGFVIERMY